MAGTVLAVEQQDQAWEQWRTGRSVRSIARDVGVPTQRVRGYFAATGGVRVRPAGRSTRHLSLSEREEVSRGLAAGHSLRRIALTLERPACTVSREVAGNGGRAAHRAHHADQAAYAREKRPKDSRLTTRPQLRAAVQRGPLPRRLTRRPRTGRAMRYPKVARAPGGRGVLRAMIPLSQRPAEATDRAVLGRWEGDLVTGPPPLGDRHPGGAHQQVHRPGRLARDQGRRCPPRRGRRAERSAGAPAPVADLGPRQGDGPPRPAHRRDRLPGLLLRPRSPWQRGTNENTNRLLRQYLPRAADLRHRDQAALDELAARLNDRPRRTLGWRTPREVYQGAGG